MTVTKTEKNEVVISHAQRKNATGATVECPLDNISSSCPKCVTDNKKYGSGIKVNVASEQGDITVFKNDVRDGVCDVNEMLWLDKIKNQKSFNQTMLIIGTF